MMGLREKAMGGVLTIAAASFVVVSVFSEWQVAALRKIGAQPPGSDIFSAATGYMTELRNGMLFFGLGLIGLAAVLGVIMFAFGAPEGVRRLGAAALGIGLLLSLPGVLA